MKWIKTHKGNVIRLGAVTEFISDGYKIIVRIGETKETACEYPNQTQAEMAYKKLLKFITEKEADAELFSFPEIDNFEYLCQFDISQLNLSVREYNACIRSNIKNIHDLMSVDEQKSYIRGISKQTLAEICKKRDKFIENIERKTL